MRVLICPWIIIAIVASTGPARAASPRLWARATPAAGVTIRSAPNFRVHAVSTSGTPSVDIYQVNTDGTTTKLGSQLASTIGTYSPGTYVTQHMAAIYWQFSTLPAASMNPPPASVTFINDVPVVPLTSLYHPQPPSVPFAANDPSLLLNIDLRNGPPAGWLNAGAGAFDATNGYTPGEGLNTGLAQNSLAAFSSAAQMVEGTIAVRFQREGVTADDSSGSHFWDSTGNTLNASTQNRQLFQMRSNTAAWSLDALIGAATFPYFQIRMHTPSMSAASSPYWQTLNSHFVPGYQDAVFADLVFTWFQNQYYLFFDGHLLAAGTLGDVPIKQMFQNICIGNSNGAGVPSGAPFGGYAIQQLQISSRFLGPVLAGPTIGLLPDSFAAAYTQRNTPVATGSDGSYQVSDIDAVQNALGLYGGIPVLDIQPGQTAAFHQIQALMFANYGFFPPIYNAGQPAHGYSQINVPIDDAYIAALNLAAPTVVMAGGTVNDVSPFKPSDADLIADTEDVMERLISGGGERISAAANPLLEQIVYLETLSSQSMPSGGNYPEPAYGNESQNVISLTRAELPGFSPAKGVGFSYVTSREWWNEAADYTSYLYGSAPADRYNGPGGIDFQNVHPDATGFSVIASHLFAPVAAAVLTTAGADVALGGKAVLTGSTRATYDLSVSNAGPLAAVDTVLTSVLPAGVTLVGGASGAGCSQSGNTLTCTVGTVAPGKTTLITVALQGSGASFPEVEFAVGDAGANDPNVANNAITLGANAAATSVPVPLWALAATGAALAGIASQRRQRRFESAS